MDTQLQPHESLSTTNTTTRQQTSFLAALESLPGERAEAFLYHSIKQPTADHVHAVVRAHLRSHRPQDAEALIDRFHDVHHPQSFLAILAYYRQSPNLDAPYRAEYLLHRMIALYEEDGLNTTKPTTEAFQMVISAYARARHPDAGRNAMRLVNTLTRLDGSPKPDETQFWNTVLHAWAWSGDDAAGHKAEEVLRGMEAPDSRSYEWVVQAHAKSKCDAHKAALRVVATARCPLDPPVYAWVINACAYSTDAWETAVEVLTRLVESPQLRPTSLAYGWFLMACRRLADEEARAKYVPWAFEQCCQDGLVSDFVLLNLREAASDEELRTLLPSGNVPAYWTRSLRAERARGKR